MPVSHILINVLIGTHTKQAHSNSMNSTLEVWLKMLEMTVSITFPTPSKILATDATTQYLPVMHHEATTDNSLMKPWFIRLPVDKNHDPSLLNAASCSAKRNNLNAALLWYFFEVFWTWHRGPEALTTKLSLATLRHQPLRPAVYFSMELFINI